MALLPSGLSAITTALHAVAGADHHILVEFSIVLKSMPAKTVYAVTEMLTLFGVGSSWDDFESLAVLFDCTAYRTVARSGFDSAAPLTQHEIDISYINEHAECLPSDEYRVAAIERISQEQRAAADRQQPERQRDDALAGALGGDPLHHEARGKEGLRDEAKQHPGIDPDDEHVVQVAADGAREFDQHVIFLSWRMILSVTWSEFFRDRALLV
jgi:hypothetical protein